MIEQVEIPHKIKNFNDAVHENMIRRMAAQVIASNKSKQETVNKHVSQVKEKLKNIKAEKTTFKKVRTKFNNLTNLIHQSHATNRAGC